MPIKPENKHRYPDNWDDIRDAIRNRSGNICEGSPVYPDCDAVNGEPHPVTGSKVVLTVAHLDHIPENCDGMDNGGPWLSPIMDLEKSNLRHWCQRCHLTYDAKHHAMNARATRRRGLAMGDLFATT